MSTTPLTDAELDEHYRLKALDRQAIGRMTPKSMFEEGVPHDRHVDDYVWEEALKQIDQDERMRLKLGM